MSTNSPSQRWWDLPAALLLLAAMSTAATRLVATKWTSHLPIAQTLVFYGVILGLALGQSRFSSRLAGFLAFAYGAFAIPHQLGLTIKQEMLWGERLSILLNRLGVILFQLANQEAVQDSLLFLVLMFALFWGLSIHAGYALARYGNGWQAILPAGLALFVIHSFDPLVARRAWYLAVYIFFGLVLVARSTFLQQKNNWQKSRTALPPHLGLDFIRFTILVTSVIILFAWTAPALANAVPAAQKAWQPVRRAWDETRDRFENVFASLRTSVVPVTEFYGSSAFLGRGNALADTQMFSVKAPTNMPTSLRMYWRARTYEYYENGQWLSTSHSNYGFDPEGQDLPIAENQGRWLGSFDFVSAVHMTTLLTPPQPMWVSRPGQVEYAENQDGSVDIATFRAAPSLQPGQEYKAQASLSYASVARLMAAGEEYPEWVTERYLQLPESITPRTRQLAEQITAGLDTPYEKVVAVTNYLRNNITYVETIEQEPPTDQEIIDWFLFDLKQGFCNYYSSAEIVLLRSVGIPARWAVGYAQGERLAEEMAPGSRFEESTFVIRQKDAHAWAEVYFPSVGWVEFEPTASQPDIFRLEADPNDNLAPNSPSDSDEERLRREMEEELAMLREERGGALPDNPQQNRMNVVYWITALALVGGLFYLAWRFRERIDLPPAPILLEAVFLRLGIQPPKRVQLWARHSSLPPLAKAYVEINRALDRTGNPPAATDTPAERAASLGQRLPPARKAAQRLVYEYEIGVFGRRPANLVIALRAATDIRQLSFKALLGRLLARLQRPSRLANRSSPN
ncbi:MAG: transglutaminase domain-containing protein [Anaerolineales bacterium]|nr:transglutaminase domain-containing protein [Anaerolineales bacterium]